MGKNGLLSCLGCSSSSTPARESSSTDTDSSSDSESLLPSRIENEVSSSCKLVPLRLQSRSHCASPDYAVGIDDEVKTVIRLLEWEEDSDVAVAVVLHGFGGTGKTTLADAVVATLDMQGWECSTVAPHDSQSRDGSVGGGSDQGERAFVYMDNANVALTKEDVEKLLPKVYKRLRILLTARDEILADVISTCGIRTKVYPVRPLHSRDAMKLLSNKMGSVADNHPINEILEICDGVPVVVKRVGSYIRQSPDKDEAFRRVIEWSKSGKPFSTAEDHYISIQEKGPLFDLEELQPSARESFLDICSFFNGWDWDKVSSIVGEKELNSLRKRALLSKQESSGSAGSKVIIRPIILTLARNMTRGKRFTSASDLRKVLIDAGNNQDDIAGIKGIWLQDNASEPVVLSAKTLDLMHGSLRVLALGDMAIVADGQCCMHKFNHIIYFEAGLIPRIPFHPSTLQGLRYLEWLPHNHDAFELTKMSSKLRVLKLNGARYARRIDCAGVFSKIQGLRTLKLAELKSLKILPDELSLLIQLEELDLTGCRNLRHLPKGLGNLKALTKLSLQSCLSLRELPDSFVKLGSLKYLNLRSCRNLVKLPEDFGSLSCLEELDLGSGGFKELPSSFEKLSSLKVLKLNFCRGLIKLPENIGNLLALASIKLEYSVLATIPRSLQRLSCPPQSFSMDHCDHLEDLPEEVCSYLKLVKNLSLKHCSSLRNLPKRFVELTSLTKLDLCYCGLLERLPEGFGQLKSLIKMDLSWCESLERLPEGFGQLKSLSEVNLRACRSLQQLSDDFHCLASLQKLILRDCVKLDGKWMATVAKIKTLIFVDIVESEMLVQRWADMETEKGEESWQFAVRTEHKQIRWNNVKNAENLRSKAASKLLSGECLLTNSHGDPFSLSTLAPNTLLLVMYEHNKDLWTGSGKLLEEFVMAHEHRLLPFQMIYVGKYFDEISNKFAERILAYASGESDALSLFYNALAVKRADSFHGSDFVLKDDSVHVSDFVLTEVAADEEGRNYFSSWKNITYSCEEFLLSKSKLYSELQNLTKTPQESNDKLLNTLMGITESETNVVFVRNYTENVGIDQLRGKTILLLISGMSEHPFQGLAEIYSKVQSSDNQLEVLSMPIPVDVRGHLECRWVDEVDEVDLLPDSDLAGFEIILRNVTWPVLRNPWSLKTEVCHFIEREWGQLNPGILVVVDPSGRVLSKNALPLVERWGAQVYPFTDEKMKQLEEEPLEEAFERIHNKRPPRN